MPIRPATRHDLPTLVDLNHEVQDIHRQAHPHRFKPPSAEVSTWFEEWLRRDDVDVSLFVDDDGVAMGYVVAIDTTRPESPFSYERRWMQLDQIAVRAECRRRGVGRALIQHVIDLADERELDVELGMWAFNAQARQTFSALGFVPLKGSMLRKR